MLFFLLDRVEIKWSNRWKEDDNDVVCIGNDKFRYGGGGERGRGVWERGPVITVTGRIILPLGFAHTRVSAERKRPPSSGFEIIRRVIRRNRRNGSPTVISFHESFLRRGKLNRNAKKRREEKKVDRSQVFEATYDNHPRGERNRV